MKKYSSILLLSFSLLSGVAMAGGTTEAGMSLKEVLGRCSFLIDGAGNTAMYSPLAGVTRVDVLPPFAGG